MGTSIGNGIEARGPAPTAFQGRLLSGSAAVAVGELRFDLAELLLDTEAERLTWRLDEILDVREIAGETHLELPPEEDGGPRVKLIVDDARFRPALDAALSRHGARTSVGLKRSARHIGLVGWFVIAGVVLGAGYFAYAVLVPRLHVFVPPEREAQLGEKVYASVVDEWTEVNAPRFAAFAAQVVDELRGSDSPYDVRITLFDQEDLNAMALPGGRVIVFSGLVLESPSPDALAGVLAHELAHVERRHSLKQILRAIGVLQFAGAAVGGGLDGFELAETFIESSSGLLVLKHSRLAEKDADTVAVQKLKAAGRSAAGLIEFFELVDAKYGDLPGTLGWLSTHPVTQDRVSRIRGLLRETPGEKTAKSTPWMTPEEWALLQEEIF